MRHLKNLALILPVWLLTADMVQAQVQGNWGMFRQPREGRRWNFNLRDSQNGYPLGTREPWHYGYNMHDWAAGYFGGGNYREYYAYGRGGVSIGNFPDSLPGPVFYRDPQRSPILHQLPIFTNPLADPTDEAPKKKRAEGNEASEEASAAGTEGAQPIKDVPAKEKVAPDLAYLTVLVPDDAQVWLEDTLMTQKGQKREFVTPKLDPGMLYLYRVKAKWKESGQVVEKEKSIVVQGGEKRTIDLRKEKSQPNDEERGLSQPRLFPKLETEGN